jgi:hypothetical protein
MVLAAVDGTVHSTSQRYGWIDKTTIERDVTHVNHHASLKGKVPCSKGEK